MNTISVPAVLDATASDVVSQGIIEIEVMLIYSDHQLTLEYRTMNTRIEKSSVKALRFVPGDLHDIEFSNRFFERKIRIRTARLSLLEGMPGASAEGLVLKVARRDREAAEMLVSRVRLDLAEARLDGLLDSDHRNNQLQ